MFGQFPVSVKADDPEFRRTMTTYESTAMGALSSSMDELCRALEHR